jgi:hypothetical protein
MGFQREGICVVRVLNETAFSSQVYPRSKVIAVFAKECDRPNELRLWIIGGDEPVEVDEKTEETLFLIQGFHLAMNYKNEQKIGSAEKSWTLERWDQVEILKRITVDDDGRLFVWDDTENQEEQDDQEEDLPSTIPLDNSSGPSAAINEEEEPMPPFNLELAQTMEAARTYLDEDNRSPIRVRFEVDDIPVEEEHAKSKRRRR